MAAVSKLMPQLQKLGSSFVHDWNDEHKLKTQFPKGYGHTYCLVLSCHERRCYEVVFEVYFIICLIAETAALQGRFYAGSWQTEERTLDGEALPPCPTRCWAAHCTASHLLHISTRQQLEGRCAPAHPPSSFSEKPALPTGKTVAKRPCTCRSPEQRVKHPGFLLQIHSAASEIQEVQEVCWADKQQSASPGKAPGAGPKCCADPGLASGLAPGFSPGPN